MFTTQGHDFNQDQFQSSQFIESPTLGAFNIDDAFIQNSGSSKAKAVVLKLSNTRDGKCTVKIWTNKKDGSEVMQQKTKILNIMNILGLEELTPKEESRKNYNGDFESVVIFPQLVGQTLSALINTQWNEYEGNVKIQCDLVNVTYADFSTIQERLNGSEIEQAQKSLAYFSKRWEATEKPKVQNDSAPSSYENEPFPSETPF